MSRASKKSSKLSKYNPKAGGIYENDITSLERELALIAYIYIYIYIYIYQAWTYENKVLIWELCSLSDIGQMILFDVSNWWEV